MRIVDTNKKFVNDEEYFLYEEASELKHELINGNLYEISGASNSRDLLKELKYFFIRSLLMNRDVECYFEDFKVKVANKTYFYTDICVCEPEAKEYFTDKPILIVKVLSEITRKIDLIDKFILYQKIPTIQYYLCVEAEQQVVLFFFKNESGEWMAETFTKDESVVDLPALNISFTVKDIYSK